MKWKKIPSLKLKYECNELGEIRNSVSKKVLKQRINNRGYYVIGYNCKERGHCIPKEVHRLIAECWCNNQYENPVVDHINGNKLDNRAANLEWVTYSENSKRAYDMGSTPKPPIKKHKQVNLKNETLNITFNTYKDAYIWLIENNKTIAKYQTVRSAIDDSITHRRNKQMAYGYKWSIK